MARNFETSKEILGFLFEPRRERANSDSSWTTEEEWSDVNERENTNDNLRVGSPIGSWCHCSKCVVMPKEKECRCCHELDSADRFELTGTQRILVHYSIPKMKLEAQQRSTKSCKLS